MSMKKCPCRDCFDRKLLCHSSCRRYQDWKKEYEEAKAGTQEDYCIPEHQLRKHWRSMRYTSRRFNKKA